MARRRRDRVPVRAPEPPLERPPAALLLPGRVPGRCRRPGRARPHDRADRRRRRRPTTAGRAVGHRARPCWACGCSCSALPLHSLPGGQLESNGVTYKWGPLTTNDSSFITSWANWNFTGYEGKPYYPEYYAVVKTMAKVGQDHGCGRAMWEYSSDLNNYGTPMALMLLPFWTNECIGSMEGLYFEASATTPYHFLNQSELSTSAVRRDARPVLPHHADHPDGLRPRRLAPADAGRALLHGLDDPDQGLRRPQRGAAADRDQRSVGRLPGGRLVARRCRSRTSRSSSTARRPGGKTWLDDTENWYLDPAQWNVLLAASGPAELAPHRPRRETPATIAVGSTAVSNIRSDHRHDLLRRDQGRGPRRGEGLVLPELAGVGGGRSLPGQPEPHGGRCPTAPTSCCPTATPRSTTCRTSSRSSASSGSCVLWRAKPVDVGPIAPMWRRRSRARAQRRSPRSRLVGRPERSARPVRSRSPGARPARARTTTACRSARSTRPPSSWAATTRHVADIGRPRRLDSVPDRSVARGVSRLRTLTRASSAPRWSPDRS